MFTRRDVSRTILWIWTALSLAACSVYVPGIGSTAGVQTRTALESVTPSPTLSTNWLAQSTTLAIQTDSEVILAVWKMREDTPIPRIPVEYHPFEEQLFKLINIEREKAGVPTLVLSRQLTIIARSHSDEMATGNFFSHNSLSGQSFQARLKAFQYTYSAASENLFAGNGPYNTPEHVLQEWLSSPNHNSNMLNPIYTEVGLGYRFNPGSTYGGYFTADFGTP